MAEKTEAAGKKGKKNSTSSVASHWETAYGLPLSEIPWEIEQPPKELVSLLASGRVKPGTALDVACGSGNYSIFLAKNGFDVTGVDFSKNALKIAEQKAKAANVSIDFIDADVRRLATNLAGKRFDFILDWSLLHHIEPADFNAYAAQFKGLLAPDGVLLLACFSEKDAPESGLQQATGKMGNVMYYRTREEIEAAYWPLKAVEYQACRLGKHGKHQGHCFVYSKKKGLSASSK